MQKYREKVRKFSGSLCLIADICDFVMKSLSRQCDAWKDLFYREFHRECLCVRSSALVVSYC